MKIESVIFLSFHLKISQKPSIYPFHKSPFFLIIRFLPSVGKLKEVDITEVIEILSIEPSKDQQAASDEISTVPSSGFGKFAMDFHAFEGLSFWVEDEDVLQVAAEPAAEDIDLSLED
jgi:hypothetical protein